MSHARQGLFNEQPQRYSDRAIRAIDDYLEEIKNKWFRNTGRERAAQLKNTIRYIQKHEQLTDTQMMWRLYELTSMAHGEGPFGSSTLLRKYVYKCIATQLGILDSQVERVAVAEQSSDVKAFAATASAGTYGSVYVPMRDDVAREIAYRKLIYRELCNEQHLDDELTPSESYKDALLRELKAYRASLKGHCFGVKFGRRSGFDRADQLIKHIENELVARQQLNDEQLMWRMRYLLAAENGSGLMGTSTELRRCLTNQLCNMLLTQAERDSAVKSINDWAVFTLTNGHGAHVMHDYNDRINNARINKITEALKQGRGARWSARLTAQREHSNVLEIGNSL